MAPSASGTGEEGESPRREKQGASQPRDAESPSRGLTDQSRRLRNSIISLVVFGAVVIGLLLAVPSLHDVLERITNASPGWTAAAVAFELLSCIGYVVLFVFLFGRLGWNLGGRLALAELAVNSVFSLSGLGGIALGAWILNSKGFSAERIARRSAVLFLITSAVNVLAVLLFGISMWAGLLPGSSNPLITLLPAGVALLASLTTIGIAAAAQRIEQRVRSYHPRTALALRSVSGAVWELLALLRRPDPRLLGALAYWIFDNLVLYACLRAFGPAPSFSAVAMAYLVGMLANSLPIPGGFVAVEGGLVGMLVLFGERDSTALAAVLVYRAIALWVPSLIGSIAFLSIRGEIGRPGLPSEAGAR